MAPSPSGSALAAGRLSRVLKINKKKKKNPALCLITPSPSPRKPRWLRLSALTPYTARIPRSPVSPGCKHGPRNHRRVGFFFFLFLIPGPALPTRTAPATENGKPCAAWLGAGRKERWPTPRHGPRATSPTATVGWQRCRRGPSRPGAGGGPAVLGGGQPAFPQSTFSAKPETLIRR